MIQLLEAAEKTDEGNQSAGKDENDNQSSDEKNMDGVEEYSDENVKKVKNGDEKVTEVKAAEDTSQNEAKEAGNGNVAMEED